MKRYDGAEREKRLSRLFERTHVGIKPGLELMTELLDALGNPQTRFLSLHVAGTNGKGSTCAILERLSRELGLKTGLYTSPHLVRVNERIRLQGQEVADDSLHRALDRIEAVEGALSRLPTFFEMLTAAAFLIFAEEGVQLAVLETGMGGRLDATNVVTPLVSVITRVDLDHMQYLGDTLSAIAFEKAGILKPGRPAVLTPQAEEAMAVLARRAEELDCPVRLSGEQVSVSGRKTDLKGQRLRLETQEADYGTLSLPLLGRFQLDALAAAVTALELMCEILGLRLEGVALRRALADLHWPARIQVLREDPPVLLDVAHNPSGAAALTEALRECFGRNCRGLWVVGQMRDKDVNTFLCIVKPFVREMLCVAVSSGRALPADELAAKAARLRIPARACSLAEAREAVRTVQDAAFTCIAGSVYLAGAWLSEGNAGADPGESFIRTP